MRLAREAVLQDEAEVAAATWKPSWSPIPRKIKYTVLWVLRRPLGLYVPRRIDSEPN